MTVKELIELLSNLSPELGVRVFDKHDGRWGEATGLYHHDNYDVYLETE